MQRQSKEYLSARLKYLNSGPYSWIKDPVRAKVLGEAYAAVLGELTEDINADIMVTGGISCLHSEQPRIGSFAYNKMYIHEVDNQTRKYLSLEYLPKYDINNKAALFTTNIYKANHRNISFISNDVCGTPTRSNSKQRIKNSHLPFLLARQVIMALINKAVPQVGMIINTGVRGVGVNGYKLLLSKAREFLKKGLDISFREVFIVDKCYNKQMWTVGLIADSSIRLPSMDLLNLSNKIEKELLDE